VRGGGWGSEGGMQGGRVDRERRWRKRIWWEGRGVYGGEVG